jgi:hypothetical protein
VESAVTAFLHRPLIQLFRDSILRLLRSHLGPLSSKLVVNYRVGRKGWSSYSSPFDWISCSRIKRFNVVGFMRHRPVAMVWFYFLLFYLPSVNSMQTQTSSLRTYILPLAKAGAHQTTGRPKAELVGSITLVRSSSLKPSGDS